MRRARLASGLVAGPAFVVTALAQAFMREGFDAARHPLSLLSLGDWGWVQILNFLLAGSLVVVFAGAVGPALQRAKKWGPRLIRGFGYGIFGAGIFVADPGLGFPPGTPEGPPAVMTAGGVLHIVSAGGAFLSLGVAALMLSDELRRPGRRGWMWYSLITGVLLLAGVYNSFTGHRQGTGNVFPVTVAWMWITALAFRVRSWREI